MDVTAEPQSALRLLQPPSYDDPALSVRASIVWYTALGGVVTALFQIVAYAFIPTVAVSEALPFLLLQGGGFVAILGGLRRGYVTAPAAVVVVGMVALISAFTFFGGGLKYSFPPLLGTAAILGSLMVGWRTGAALTAWAGVATLAVYFGGSSEVLLAAGQAPEDILLSVELVTVLLGGGLVTYAAWRLSAALAAERTQTQKAQTALERLEKARAFTEHVVQSMAESVLLVRADGTVHDANDAAVRLFGAGTAEQLVGQAIDRLVDPADLADLEAAATPGTRAFGQTVVRAGGAERFVRVARSPVEGEDGSRLLVFVLSDISEQVEARRRSDEAARAAQEANLAKSRFLANMSHELRTPLNAVIGYSDMLIDDVADPLITDDVRRIRQAGSHLLSLINDVLDMSKIEAGRIEVVTEPVVLDEVLDELCDVVRPVAERRGNRVLVDRQTDLPILNTDARKIRQILLNLASNAVKFTEQGTVTIRVRSKRDALMIDVVDTGIGIDPEAVDKLFNPFVQADPSTSRKYGGTGLGLALSRRFAEMLGGELLVQSTPSVGSTFTLVHPIDTLVVETPAPEVDTGRAPLVLCVDDDAPTLDLLGRVLRRQGLRVAQAQSGLDALKVAREHRPAVITLDVMMPEMDGWTLLQRLRADEDLRDIPVVMVSMVDHSHASALSLGASDYLVKPVEGDRLVRTLRRYLARGSGRVLVVDDEEDIRDLMRRLLAAEGWQVSVAENSRVALEMLPEAAPDLVVLDLMMPEMDGFAFVERVRDDPRFRSVPIVVLTAMDLDRAQWEMLSANASQVVRKGGHGFQQVLRVVRRFAHAEGTRAGQAASATR